MSQRIEDLREDVRGAEMELKSLQSDLEYRKGVLKSTERRIEAQELLLNHYRAQLAEAERETVTA
jgi:chromosome segregation ATPase